MPKEIKKFYDYMNLSFSSTVQEVQEREKDMINTLQAKALKKNKNYQTKIDKVSVAADGIIKYIEKNGVTNKKDNLFNTSTTSICIQLILLVSIIFVLGMTIYTIV